MKFKKGERVAFLYEKGGGVIHEIINEHQVKIVDEDGFEHLYFTKDLAKIHGTLDEEELNPPMKDEGDSERKSNYSVIKGKSGENQRDFWELDLHIESLTDQYRGLSNFEIMKIQLAEFKRFFNKAKAHQIQKIIVIHGVGEGVLKNEIRTYLSNQEFLEFYDASYLEYGKGATEIRFGKF